MRVLLTGASGFVGSWVARELVGRGLSVRALLRPTARLDNLEGLPVERATGDVLDRTAVERALEGCEAVVHTAGVAHFRPGDEERMYAVNGGSVEIVLGAARAMGVRRALLTSSVSVMGGSREPRVADERTESNAEALGIDYFLSKRRGELAALELFRRGLPVVIVRPGMILGPGDVYRSSATYFLALARRQMRLLVNGGSSFCDVRDVARGHAEALLRGRPGEVYLLGGENLDMADVAGRVARLAGVAPPRIIPRPLAYAAAAASESLARALGRDAVLSRQLVKAARLYTYVSSAKARAELGYSSRPFDDSLRDTLRWFMERGRLRAATPELRAIEQGVPLPTP
jgi:dihydroflavonol-4-reductase